MKALPKLLGSLLVIIILGAIAVVVINIATNTDPYIIDLDNGKTVTFDVTSFYEDGKPTDAQTRVLDHDIINTTDFVLYCNLTTDHYFQFHITLEATSFNVQISYHFRQYTIAYSDDPPEVLAVDYLAYNGEHDLSYLNDNIQYWIYDTDKLSIISTLVIAAPIV